MTKLAIILVLTFVLRYTLTRKAREFLTPYAFAYYIAFVPMTQFCPVSLYYPLALPAYLCVVALLLNGFRKESGRRPVFGSFLLFATYFIVSSAFGNDKVDSVVLSLLWLVECVCVGYFSGPVLFQNRDVLRRTLNTTVLLVVVACGLYYKFSHGNYAMHTGENERLAFGFSSESSEVTVGSNTLGSRMASLALFPIMQLTLVGFQHEVKIRFGSVVDKAMVVLDFLALGMICLLVIQTGSRNALLALIVVGVYAVLGKWGFGERTMFQRMVKFIAIGIMCAGVLYYAPKFLGNNYEIRFFQDEDIHSDSFGSGRFIIFKDFVNPMTDSERWVGGGASPRKVITERYRGLGATTLYLTHNSGVHLFCQSGVVGCVLFFWFLCVFASRVFRLPMGVRDLAIVMFATWAVVGLGEAQCFARSSPAFKVLLGLAMALCDQHCERRMGSYMDPRPIFWR